VLREILKGQDKAARIRAALALWKIEHQEKDVLPVLLEALKDPDEPIRFLATFALGEIGPDAKVAVPALLEALKAGEESFKGFRYRNVEQALKKIDPKAATKAGIR
jgi:HEAT repeat protein